jgi:predicted amidohydrolase
MKNNEKIRFGGAQIPCSVSIDLNRQTIKKSIDWAAENQVEYLVTPEGSLSGYNTNFDKNLSKLIDALKEIEEYAANKNVGLCLGTLWQENFAVNDKQTIPVKKNQIRYYTKNGRFLGATNKTVMAPTDTSIGITPDERLTGIALPYKDEIIPTAGLICADLYGWGAAQGGLPQQYYDIGVKLFIHATNAERNTDALQNEIEEIWIEAWLRRMSYLQRSPVIVVDNCFMMDGTSYDGKTMTQSGVLINGEWVVKASRFGTQHFYYDFPLDDLILKEPVKTDSRQTP